MMKGSSFRQTKRRRTSSKTAASSSVVPVSAARAEANLAKKVLKLEKLYKGIRPELKFQTTSFAFVNVPAAGAVNQVMFVGQGTDFNQRIGDKIRIKNIYVRCRLSTAAASIGASPTDDEFSRFAVVQDMQTISDTVPAAADIVFNTILPQDPLPNVATQQGRFRWLWVSPLICHARVSNTNLQGAVTTPYAPTQSPVCIMNKKVDIPVLFNGAANTDFQKNSIFVLHWTNQAAGTTDSDFTTRISFTDD